MAEAYRHAPYDIEVEQAVLGAILVDPVAFHQISDRLKAQEFYDPLHQRIFELMDALAQSHSAITPLTLHAAMKADPGLQEVGGHAYLAGLAQAVPAMPNLKEYTAILRGSARRRALIAIGEDIVNAAYGPDHESGGAEKIADRASEALYEAVHADDPGRGPLDLIDLGWEAIRETERAVQTPKEICLTAGLRVVDENLGPIYRGDMLVIGSPPNVGKSGLAQHIAVANGVNQDMSLLFSLEMGDVQMAMRYLAQISDVSSDRMRRGRVSDAEFEAMVVKLQDAGTRPPALKIDGTPGLSVAQIRARCHAVRRRHGSLKLALIDHLRFIRPANPRHEERDQIQQITRDLKELAKELNIAIVLISHLNRDFNKRQNKRPVMTDLYGASAIEQNADSIWFLHSEHYFLLREEPAASNIKDHANWLADCEREQGWSEIFSAKQRMGPIGTARVKFNPAFVRFSDPDDPKTPGLSDADLVALANRGAP